MTEGYQQFIRKASLLVIKPSVIDDDIVYVPDGSALDLSAMQFQFETSNQDEEGPSNCAIRVFNLSQATVQSLLNNDYSQVVLQAGYEGSFGVIFQGDIKQFRVGRLDGKDTYIDILAADGDLAYNFGVVNTTLAAPQTSGDNILLAAQQSLAEHGVSIGENLAAFAGILPRGKVMFGMSRTFVRDLCDSAGATWSIQNGKINIIPLTSYLPGEAVQLTSATGLLGVPEQTQDGIKAKCLLNPKIKVGSRVQINNASINQILSTQGLPVGQVPFNQWTQVQLLANVANDGFYRVYVAEHSGDTRGPQWETNLTCLAIDNSTGNVKPYG